MATNQQARQKAILESLRQGNTRTAAYAAAGVSSPTFYRWFAQEEFRSAVEEAEAKAELEYVKVVHTAANSGRHWQAAAWWLERRRHEDWKRRDELDLKRLSTEQLFALFEAADRSGTSGARSEPADGRGDDRGE